MEGISEIYAGYQRLIFLIENEQFEIVRCMQGEMLEAYIELLRMEVDELYTYRNYLDKLL